jgi:hypothetical protein
MSAASSHSDSARPVQNATDAPAAPQHHGLFLQPHFTVELPPLEDEEDDMPPALPLPTQRRRGVNRGR